MDFNNYELCILDKLLNFDAEAMGITAKFEYVLRHSLSLDLEEKKRVLKHYPDLSEFQLKSLIEVWEEETVKFEELEKENPDDVRKLVEQVREDWEILVKEYEAMSIANEKLDIDEVKDQYDLLTPKAIKIYLDEYVRGQDDAKQELSSALYYQSLTKELHSLGESEQLKPSLPIILAGPTGNGKTYVVQKACEITGLPFIHVNTPTMVSEGYVGYSISDLGRAILGKSKNKIEGTQFAVIFLDEFDKLGMSDSKNSYGQQVMHQLLRIIEGGDLIISPDSKRGDSNEIVIPTKNMLFILAGAFQNKFDNDNKPKVGFNNKVYNSNKDIELSELFEYGIPKEILGRIGAIITLDKLDEEDMYAILTKSKESPLKEFIDKIELHGDKVEIDDDVFYRIAKEAAQSPFGVRTIRQILQKIFSFPIFDAPGKEIKQYRITLDLLENILKEK